MNIRLAAVCATLSCLAAPACIASADQKPLPPAAAPQVVTEKDVVGNWMDRNCKYWQISLEPNHTLNVSHGDWGETKTYVSAWKLVNNYVIVSDSAALKKQGFFDDWGDDFLVMKVKNHVVLLPVGNLPLVQQYGLASPLCLWRSTKNGLDDLVDKTIDNRKVMEQLLRRDESKQKQDNK